MPSFTYCGASSGMYPMLRDAYDVPVGTVKPGDVLEFDQAPDADWQPYESGSEPAPEPAAEPAADTIQDSSGDQPDPQPGTQDDNEAGTGQEEG